MIYRIICPLLLVHDVYINIRNAIHISYNTKASSLWTGLQGEWEKCNRCTGPIMCEQHRYAKYHIYRKYGHLPDWRAERLPGTEPEWQEAYREAIPETGE